MTQLESKLETESVTPQSLSQRVPSLLGSQGIEGHITGKFVFLTSEVGLRRLSLALGIAVPIRDQKGDIKLDNFGLPNLDFDPSKSRIEFLRPEGNLLLKSPSIVLSIGGVDSMVIFAPLASRHDISPYYIEN